MLIEILDILKKGKNYSIQELSTLLKTDISTVKAQLEYLEQQGYIKKIELQADCNKSCNGCKGCIQQVVFPAIWELTK